MYTTVENGLMTIQRERNQGKLQRYNNCTAADGFYKWMDVPGQSRYYGALKCIIEQ